MKYLVLGDLHGQEPEIHIEETFDAVIATGDFCPNIGGIREYMFKAAALHREGQDMHWYDLMGRGKAREAVEQSKEKGRNVLEALNQIGKPVYVIPGNWDWTANDTDWQYLRKNQYQTLLKGLGNIVNVERAVADTGKHSIVGYGVCSSPEKTVHEDDLEHVTAAEQLQEQRTYETLHAEISVLFEQAEKPVIFLTHNVPFNTRLDTIENKDSDVYGRHMGSLIARDLTEAYQPVITISGHMHNHYGVDHINGTPVINAGYGNDKNTVVTVEDSNITDIQLHPEHAVTMPWGTGRGP